jgi:YjbE family integral membrane protein
MPKRKAGFPGIVMEYLLANFVTLASVVLIDLVLAGDNAIVIGMAAHRLPPEARRRAICFGIVLALVLRIAFALVTVQLMAIIGLLLAGGLLLLWVAWKMARELHSHQVQALASGDTAAVDLPVKTTTAAVVQIAIADVSMSLDNVLAVAGAARDNTAILAFGLIFSVLLMGLAATFVASILHRFPWLNYIGLTIIALVATIMIYDGAQQVLAAITGI